MSKLIKEIQARQTNVRSVSLSRLTSVLKVEEDVFKPVPYAIQYKIGVALEQSVQIDERDKEKLGLIKEKVRASIAEHVFGEFRPLLTELTEIALNCPCSDTRQALFESVDKIMNKMFVEGVR